MYNVPGIYQVKRHTKTNNNNQHIKNITIKYNIIKIITNHDWYYY